MRIVVLFLFSTLTLFANPLEKYLELIEAHPKILGPLGNYEKGEIEIVLDVNTILQIQSIAEKRLMEKEVPHQLAHAWSRIGVIAEDQYLYLLRDGVIFPSGIFGTYDRIVWKSGFDGSPGITLVPILEKKILLNLNYRHATRSWELELPRGMRNKGESLKDAAARELKEETGFILDDALLLGTMCVDSGIISSLIPIIVCKANNSKEASHDYTEAIIESIALTTEEAETALLQGFWSVDLPDRTIRANVRDPFLAYALLHVKLRYWN